MIDRIITIAGTALLLAAVTSPAMATVGALPEPATMSLFGLGVAGAYLAKRLIGRK
jgi:PEP-CTERM motif